MKKNVGIIDRSIRILFAIGIAILLLTHQVNGSGALFLGFIAVVFTFTGLTSFCPCYVRLNVNTGKKTDEESEVK